MKPLFVILLTMLCLSHGYCEVPTESDRKPTPITTPAPDYPDELRRKRISGVVLVEFVIGIDGSILKAKAMKSPDERLSKLAEEAVMKWKFEPGIKDGVPIEVRATMPITFDLKKRK
jgi:periplasmic protein TonB